MTGSNTNKKKDITPTSTTKSTKHTVPKDTIVEG